MTYYTYPGVGNQICPKCNGADVSFLYPVDFEDGGSLEVCLQCSKDYQFCWGCQVTLLAGEGRRLCRQCVQMRPRAISP